MAYKEKTDVQKSSADSRSLKIVKNSETDAGTLTGFAKDPKDVIRWNVALHQNTPKEVLQELSNDKNPKVRQMVAKNTNTPDLTRNILACDFCLSVRRAAA